MPSSVVYPGDNRDGCGPYGRHLTGAVDWQKYYSFSDNHGGQTALLLAGNTDYLIPVPPPSDDIVFSNVSFSVANIGTTATLWAAVLDAEAYPTLTRVLDLGEVSVVGTGLISLSGAYTLRRNGRYIIAVCGAGVANALLNCASTDRKSRSWLGAMATDLSNVGHLLYSRAYGAFPATYNGVFGSAGVVRVLAAGAC